MTLNEFIYWKNIRPADVIVIKKRGWGLLDHYVVYLGIDNGEHVFSTNMIGKGVQVIRGNRLIQMMPKFEAKRIRYFTGNEHQRRGAVQRAINAIGQEGYDPFYNNCETYANYVQTGKKFSHQAQVIGGGLIGLVLLGASGAFQSNKDKEQ